MTPAIAQFLRLLGCRPGHTAQDLISVEVGAIKPVVEVAENEGVVVLELQAGLDVVGDEALVMERVLKPRRSKVPRHIHARKIREFRV